MRGNRCERMLSSSWLYVGRNGLLSFIGDHVKIGCDKKNWLTDNRGPMRFDRAISWACSGGSQDQAVLLVSSHRNSEPWLSDKKSEKQTEWTICWPVLRAASSYHSKASLSIVDWKPINKTDQSGSDSVIRWSKWEPHRFLYAITDVVNTRRSQW